MGGRKEFVPYYSTCDLPPTGAEFDGVEVAREGSHKAGFFTVKQDVHDPYVYKYDKEGYVDGTKFTMLYPVVYSKKSFCMHEEGILGRLLYKIVFDDETYIQSLSSPA